MEGVLLGRGMENVVWSYCELLVGGGEVADEGSHDASGTHVRARASAHAPRRRKVGTKSFHDSCHLFELLSVPFRLPSSLVALTACQCRQASRCCPRANFS